MKHTLRKGIAMIELIFALVIMGITLMSAPMLVSQATTSSTVTFQQESIAMIASHTAALMTYQWDENNTVPIANPDISILRVPVAANTDNELDDGNLSNSLRAPLGTFTIPAARERIISINVPAVPPVPARFATALLGQDANDNDDIDDFTGIAHNLVDASVALNVTNLGEYMDTNITITPNITYADDRTNYNAAGFIDRPNLNVSVTPTHIKSITNTFRSNNLPTQITLNAFMCNIGANPNLDIRTF